MPQKTKIKSNTKQVVILGGGFAGLGTALGLARSHPSLKIVIVDKNSYFSYHPGLYETATSSKSTATAAVLKGTVALHFGEILARYTNITFRQAYISEIDTDRRLVRTDNGDLSYDVLVVALGSQPDYFNIPGLSDYALTLKSFEDSVRIRNHVSDALGLYQKTHDPSCLNFVIGGGGFSGVEFAGELVGYIKHLIGGNKNYHAPANVIIVEAASQLLSGMSSDVSAKAYERLKNLGVKVLIDTKIASIDHDTVYLANQKKIKAKTIIWTGGAKAAPVPSLKSLAQDPKARIIVGSRLSLESHPEVLVLGDSSSWVNPATGKPLPQTALVAMHQAEYAVNVIPLILQDKEVPVYRPLKKPSYVVPLGGRYGLYVIGEKVFAGFFPYIVRRLSDLQYFMRVLPWYKALSYWLKGTVVYLKND
jgi:NADH dehydrogenase